MIISEQAVASGLYVSGVRHGFVEKSNIPAGTLDPELRDVLHPLCKAKFSIPFARHPVVVELILIRAIFSLPAGRTRQIEKECRADPMPSKSPHRRSPSPPLHVELARHDFVKVGHVVVNMMKEKLAAAARHGGIRIEKEYAVMIR